MAIGIEGYNCTRTLGRKRVVVSNNMEASPPVTPVKRMCSGRIALNFDMSPLEALPLEILIKVLCGVEHEDLKPLFHVSKTIREATLIAKASNFDHRTPKKNIVAFHNAIDMDDANGFLEIEAPNAPLRKSNLRLNGKKLSDISVALFASMDEVIAKANHFDHSTPRKNIVAFHDAIDMDNANGFLEIETPNAPLRKSNLRVNVRKQSNMSITLFASMDEEQCTKK